MVREGVVGVVGVVGVGLEWTVQVSAGAADQFECQCTNMRYSSMMYNMVPCVRCGCHVCAVIYGTGTVQGGAYSMGAGAIMGMGF